MSDFILRAKHWQVFLMTVVALFLTNFTIEDSALLTGIVGAIGYCLYFVWFAVMGNTLFSHMPREIEYSLTWFLINIFLVAVSCASSAILMGNHTYHAQGVEALPGFYFFFAMIHVPWFLAVSLVAIEKKRKPEFGFYFGTLILFLFWPIGLWFIQPRLNKVWRQQQ
ncbi:MULTISPECIES: hypothetical protein [Hymenobacter]